MLAIAAAPAFAQSVNEPGSVIVRPARVPVAGSPPTYDRGTNLPSPPPGPIESRLVSIPEGSNLRLPSDLRYGQPAPPASGVPSALATTPSLWSSAPAAAQPPAAAPSGPALAVSKPASEPSASSGAPFGIISFAGQSANLTDVTRAELDQIAKRITDKRLRHIELRAFADGGNLDSRKIALARALIVRSYLIDRGVKSRIEVGSFSGDGGHVEILVPNT